MSNPETFVATRDIKAAVQGRETDVLDGLGIDWRRCGKSGHIPCPYVEHQSNGDNWRWDARKARAFCSCQTGHADGILDIVMKCAGVDIEGAKVQAAEMIGRQDLIKTKGGGKAGQRTDATSLLNPPTGIEDASLPAAYLGHRLGIPADDALMPSTASVGWKAASYWEAPAKPASSEPRNPGYTAAEWERARRPPWPTFGTTSHARRKLWLREIQKAADIMATVAADVFAAFRCRMIDAPTTVTTEDTRLFNRLARAAWEKGIRIDREPPPWPTWGMLSHFGRLAMFDAIVAEAAFTPAEAETMTAFRTAYYRHQVTPGRKLVNLFNAACRNLWERGWRPEGKAA